MPRSCGGCGKFISATDAIKCTKCRLPFHAACVGLSGGGSVPSQWQCPECKKNLIRDNNSETPVRGRNHGQGADGEHQDSVTGVAAKEKMDDSQECHDMQATLKLLLLEVRGLRAEVGEIRSELLGLKSSITACNTRMDALESRLDGLETHAKEHPPLASTASPVVEQLKKDLNNREQELMANDLMITSMPESNGENPTHVVLLVASKMGVNIDERDIVCAERIGGRVIKAVSAEGADLPRPRALMVRFVRREQRNALLSGARVRRGATTEDLGVPGPARRFFINERLTRTNQLLFRRARAAADRHGWRFVWTKQGRILARRGPKDPTHRIAEDGDILQCIGSYE